MSFTLKVSGDVKAVARDLDRVSRRVVPRAAAQALNRAVSRVRTESIRAVAGAKNIPQKALRGGVGAAPGGRKRRPPRLIIRGRANPRKLHVRILALVLPILSSSVGKPRQKGGVASSGGHSWPGAFVATMRSGHVGVFRRQRPTRRVGKRARSKPKARGSTPIKEQAVALEPEATRIVGRQVTTVGAATFRTEFNRLMALRLRTR